MKFTVLIVLLIIFSCFKESSTMEADCVDFALIPSKNVKNSKDLAIYLLKEDTTYYRNGDTLFASAIKLVPSQGYICWRSNNYVNIYRGNHGLVLINYADTADWKNQVSWSFMREILSVQFDINKIGKQKVVDYQTYLKDTTLLQANYSKAADGGDVVDATWKLDMSHENYIEIIHIDLKKMVFEGNFELSFKLEEQSKLPNVKYSDKVHFRCGKFKAILHNE